MNHNDEIEKVEKAIFHHPGATETEIAAETGLSATRVRKIIQQPLTRRACIFWRGADPATRRYFSKGATPPAVLDEEEEPDEPEE